MHDRQSSESAYAPRLIAWEITRRCALHCKHCRASAQSGPYEGELSLDEIRQVLRSIARHYKPIIILTGGEPLMRPDLFDIIDEVVRLGLRPVLATCGGLLTPDMARRLVSAGIQRISVSIDGPDARSHDDFRGAPGAFDSAMAALDAAREAGLEFQINTTVTRRNMDALEDILNLAVKRGAAAFHPFLLVPTGRGRDLTGDLLDAAEYEKVLNRIYDLRASTPIPFKPTCAPHYYRIYRQREAEAGRLVTPQTHGLDAMSKGCMGGTSFAFISHVGKVQICGFLAEEAGDLRKAGLDFQTVWEESPLFRELRDYRNYKGACGHCDYRRWCGGCRARACAVTGSYLDTEPFCAYAPK
ncbi:MAG TPA: radical SAM protein [Candidatus Bathyarchaeia archaeon]|nr:radical SAM protein [Candidatus Bathyarchaeia archaeon]